MHGGVWKSEEKPKARQGSRLHAAAGVGRGRTVLDALGGGEGTSEYGGGSLQTMQRQDTATSAPPPPPVLKESTETLNPQWGCLGEILATCGRGVQQRACRAEGVPTRAQSGDGV